MKINWSVWLMYIWIKSTSDQQLIRELMCFNEVFKDKNKCIYSEACISNV